MIVEGWLPIRKLFVRKLYLYRMRVVVRVVVVVMAVVLVLPSGALWGWE